MNRNADDDEIEDEDTCLTVGETTCNNTDSAWDENIDPWMYPTPARSRRLNRNALTIPSDGPCIDLPCLVGKRRVGKLIVVWETTTDEGRPKFLCVIPACWVMTLFTEALIIGISLLAYASSLPSLGWFWWFLSFFMLTYSAGSLFKTATTDPGIVPRVMVQPDQSWTWSERAQSYRAPGVVYCNESGILVREMDHFCPWTGTTIAGGNIRKFYLRILYYRYLLRLFFSYLSCN